MFFGTFIPGFWRDSLAFEIVVEIGRVRSGRRKERVLLRHLGVTASDVQGAARPQVRASSTWLTDRLAYVIDA